MEPIQNITQAVASLSPAGLIALVAVVALGVVYKALDVVGKASRNGSGE